MSTALVKAREEKAAIQNRLKNVRDKMRAEGANVMRTAASVVTGYGLGYADARWGENAVAGMDNTLAVGLAATAMAYFDVGGEAVNPHLRAMGDTSLGIYAYKTGYAQQRERAS